MVETVRGSSGNQRVVSAESRTMMKIGLMTL